MTKSTPSMAPKPKNQKTKNQKNQDVRPQPLGFLVLWGLTSFFFFFFLFCGASDILVSFWFLFFWFCGCSLLLSIVCLLQLSASTFSPKIYSSLIPFIILIFLLTFLHVLFVNAMLCSDISLPSLHPKCFSITFNRCSLSVNSIFLISCSFCLSSSLFNRLHSCNIISFFKYSIYAMISVILKFEYITDVLRVL